MDSEKFLNINQIMLHLDSLQRIDVPPNMFDIIKFSNFEIETMAGIGTFCEPYLRLSRLTYYTSVQVSLYENIKGERHLLKPKTDLRFDKFTWAKYFTYADVRGNLKDSYMGNRVPLEELCSMIREVYKVSRLKMFY